jgi:DNA-binding IclR family transcriptional regulator
MPDTRTDGLLPLGRQVLEALSEAPRPVSELPSRWPLTRAHLRVLVERLHDERLVEAAHDGGGEAPAVRLTEAGRRVVAGGGG